MAQVSIMVPSPTRAPTLTKLGISTAPLAMKAERRTTAPGTARKPAARNLASSQPRNLESTLSHHTASSGAPEISFMSFRRKDSSTAFFSHSCTFHSPPTFSATRRAPLSRASSAASTASRSAPLLVTPSCSRFSQAASMAVRQIAHAQILIAVQKLGKVVGFMVDIAMARHPSSGPCLAQGESRLQPHRGHAQCPGRHQIAGDVVEHGGRGRGHIASLHHAGIGGRLAAWAEMPWCGCPRPHRTDPPCSSRSRMRAAWSRQPLVKTKRRPGSRAMPAASARSGPRSERSMSWT